MKRKILLLTIIYFTLLIRLFRIGEIPPSLYSDEVNQGYNAYSILKTGHDEHGSFLPISLRSFGDWKPPLQTYMMIPFIPVLGLTEEAVRLPSVIFGTATMLVIYSLIRQIMNKNKKSAKLALLSAFLFAISPVSILESRSAMLVSVGLFFLILAIYLFLKGLKRPVYFLLSSISFALTVYAYYGLRVVAPLLLMTLIILYRDRIIRSLKFLIPAGLTGLILILPLIIAMRYQPDVVFGRARTVSVFYDQGVKLRQWELISQDGLSFAPFFSRLYHNSVTLFGRDIIRRFLVHFDGNYLFRIGDQSQPFQIPNMGILYLADLAGLITGVYALMKLKRSVKVIIISWLVISIIPAALTFMTPSSNRTYNAIFPFMLITGLGILTIYDFVDRKVIVPVVAVIIYSVSLGYFMYQYFLILPRNFAQNWNYGWREAVKYVDTISAQYDTVVVLDSGGMPYTYFLFYDKVDPEYFQKYAVHPYIADQFGFEHVDSFGKFYFPTEPAWKYMKDNLQKKTLYIVSAAQADIDTNYIKLINYPNGQAAYKIFEGKREL
jgi:4-amino-4-deoxy-L-arabinose transferase-like glycosyltransferase